MFKFDKQEWETTVQKATQTGACGDIVFLMCMLPSEPTKDWSMGQFLIDLAVRNFQPVPSVVHCELFIPPSNSKDQKHFATYIGREGGWYDKDSTSDSFYFGASTWRAIPIAVSHASTILRQECQSHCGTPYSLLKYPFSAAPLRAFAGLLPDRNLTSAHCATLSARTLARALPGIGLKHPPAWYGPSTLLIEASTGDIADRTKDYLTSRTYSKSTPEEEAVLDTINALTRGSDEAIRALSHASCEEAIREMAAGVAARFGTDDEVGGAIAQGQLATAILKWSLTNGL
jgi:hypothetical protein